jgi:HSP20 family molecular chaperone IbpA
MLENHGKFGKICHKTPFEILIKVYKAPRREVEKMEQEEKRVAVPMININHNDDDTGLVIKVDLAGASKDNE